MRGAGLKYQFQISKAFLRISTNFKSFIGNWKFQSAFTLIELLIVITIIAILVAAAGASWTNAQQKSRDGRRKSDLKGIQQALELYFQQNGHYPQSSNDGKLMCPGSASVVEWGKNFTCDGGVTSYMNPLPKDPVNSSGYTYYFESSVVLPAIVPLTYTISAKIENEKDPDIKSENLTCTPQQPGGYNYCVINP